MATIITGRRQAVTCICVFFLANVGMVFGKGISLSDCLASTTGECELQPGRYEVPDSVINLNSKGFKVKSAGGGEVVIDGTKELDLMWKECKVADHSDCGSGVYVADLEGKLPYQLFLGGDDVHDRELILPARWPNVPTQPAHYAADVPSWLHAYDGRRAWSIIKDGEGTCAGPHAPSSCKSYRDQGMDTGVITDDGGAERVEHIETEEGDQHTAVIKGQGPLEAETFSATGATFIASFGKRLTEVGVVESHQKGSATFTYRMPNCATELYTSCGKKAKFFDVKYYLENSVALIDVDYEYAVKDGKIYMKWPSSYLKDEGGTLKLKPAKGKLWARLDSTPTCAFNIENDEIEATDVTYFGTAPCMDKKEKKVKILRNKFLYSFASKRVIGNYDWAAVPYLSVQGDGCQVEENEFKYAEGVVLRLGGNAETTLKNNLIEFNGYVPTNGPQTIFFGTGQVSRNTLRWNGQVSGFKLTGAKNAYTLNEIEHQNFGELLHDGAGMHVQTAAQDGTFEKNWIHDSHQCMGIRFDTASTTTMDEIGRHGQLKNNVMWKADMTLKGDEHTIAHNTLFDASVTLVKAFGEQQGMNEHTHVEDNLLDTWPKPRGRKWSGPGNIPNEIDVEVVSVAGTDPLTWMSLSQKWGWEAKQKFEANSVITLSAEVPKDAALREVLDASGALVKNWDQLIVISTRADLFPIIFEVGYTLKFRTERRPKGPMWTLGDVTESGNKADVCAKLKDCHHHDFRPLDDTETAGAYSVADKEEYWIPGHQTTKARRPIPLSGASGLSESHSLLFLQAKDCTDHTVELQEIQGATQTQALSNGKNVWENPSLEANKNYQWRVTACGNEVSEWWTFSTGTGGAAEPVEEEPPADPEDPQEEQDEEQEEEGEQEPVEEPEEEVPAVQPTQEEPPAEEPATQEPAEEEPNEMPTIEDIPDLRTESVEESKWCDCSTTESETDNVDECALQAFHAGSSIFSAELDRQDQKVRCRISKATDATCSASLDAAFTGTCKLKTGTRSRVYKVYEVCEDVAPSAYCVSKDHQCTKNNPSAAATRLECKLTCCQNADLSSQAYCSACTSQAFLQAKAAKGNKLRLKKYMRREKPSLAVDTKNGAEISDSGVVRLMRFPF